MKGKLLKGLTALACLSLAVGLVACGGGNGGKSTESSNVSGESSSSVVDSSSEDVSSDIVDENSDEVDSSEDDGEDEEIFLGTEGLVYTIHAAGDAYSVTGYEGTATEVVIPPRYKDLPVKGIGHYAFKDCDNLTRVTIPASVTYLMGSFYDCNSLTSVTFEKNSQLTSIGGSAFYRCVNLAEIVIPDLVTSIGNSAFNGCENLIKVSIPEGVTTIADNAFNGCESLVEIVLPNSLTSISSGVFARCNGLKEIVIPDSVTSIGMNAFYGCDGLISVTFGENSQLTTIGKSAFYENYNLLEIVMPKKLVSIGEYAFYACNSLTRVMLDKDLMVIDNWAFEECLRLVEVVNKSPHITIERGAVQNGYIGKYSFDVYNSDDVFEGTKIFNDNECIYYACGEENILIHYVGAESKLIIPSHITEINRYAFYRCTTLIEVIIPEMIANIAYRAFYDCDSLTIYCETKRSPSGWDSNWNYSDCPVVWDCNNNDVADDGYVYAIINGLRYGIKDGVAMAVRQLSNITVVNIPESITYKDTVYSVTSIGDRAFSRHRDTMKNQIILKKSLQLVA